MQLGYLGREMRRIAVFVDSGYLFAQGSAAIAGSKQPRLSIQLDAQKAVDALKLVARDCAPECELLRIYWYDGAIGGSRPTSDQASLASLDDVKLRLGFVNSHEQQKGVDSLIVTDLIELARLKSISDALLLSGDEDVRIGVQIAQNYGVRVHLLGIMPARGSQSAQLMQEADTTREWTADVIAAFVGLRTAAVSALEPQAAVAASARLASTAGARLDATVSAFVAELGPGEPEAVQAYWAEGNRGVPSDLDRPLLVQCRAALGRDLDADEKKRMRAAFRTCIEQRMDSARQARKEDRP